MIFLLCQSAPPSLGRDHQLVTDGALRGAAAFLADAITNLIGWHFLEEACYGSHVLSKLKLFKMETLSTVSIFYLQCGAVCL